MKKLLTTLIAVLTLTAVIALAGCGNSNIERTEIDEQTSIIFTASNSVTALTDSTTVKDYLDALKENGELDFEGYEGDYGFYITSFDGQSGKVISSTANSYEGYDWAFYIDFTTLEGDNAIYATDYKTCEYNGKTLYTASYGVSGIPCIEGHTYAFVYEYSNMSW